MSLMNECERRHSSSHSAVCFYMAVVLTRCQFSIVGPVMEECFVCVKHMKSKEENIFLSMYGLPEFKKCNSYLDLGLSSGKQK